jgi:hypothetical protein
MPLSWPMLYATLVLQELRERHTEVTALLPPSW